MNRSLKYFAMLLLCAGAFGAGYKTHEYQNTKEQLPEENEAVNLGMDGLINPLLDCGGSTHVRVPLRIHELTDNVEKIIEKFKKKYDVEMVSAYYRDLNNGPSFEVNADELFAPASLLKVPVLIGYFKLLESDPKLFSKKIKFDPEKYDIKQVKQLVNPPPPLVPNQDYTIEELIIRMTLQSDNTAAAMLSQQKYFSLDQVIKELGVRIKTSDDKIWMSMKSYTSVFRILYNSTYLSKKLSAAVLDLLTRVDFHEGINKGVAPGILVAHKFGERSVNNMNHQFHDCGIVYHPRRPYLVCIMTRGQDPAPLVKVIQEISAEIFRMVDTLDKK